ncbi:myosin-binding protein 7-like [Zingiber officinale]|uniref:GTD-binding domain-containing protein n=1 Tax=Zingiber officinale TaxID=94328 RepID=A0A8J5HFT3_ZINOF|nr:myosin-binding protein 7-like [Zingiber officinale]KAG6526060.1 hypothetical protein ZIOFF_016035 [Zingiber officinale]
MRRRRPAIALCDRLDIPAESMAIPDGGGDDFDVLRCSTPLTVSWHRCLKRKLDERDSGARCLSFFTGEDGGNENGFARVDIENEAAALREALASHKQSVEKLLAELEEERNASSSAATEAMSMIIRLQREKAEAQMEARQFRRLADEKMAHDQQEIAVLQDLLFKRDQTVEALNCEVQAYRHRLLSYGIGVDDGDEPPSEPQTPDTATTTPTRAAAGSQFDALSRDYPALRCADDSAADLDKYNSGEIPCAADSPRGPFRPRIHQFERVQSGSFRSFKDKGVVVRQSSRRWSSHVRSFSYGSFSSGLEFPVDDASDCGARDDISDRVYTVDAVHGATEDYVSTPRELHGKSGIEDEAQEAEFKRLYLRLQALEADRESMRQSSISMGTDKAQITLLKEIAQQMCKEVATERKVVKRSSSIKKSSSLMSTVKNVISIVLWRKRSSRVKFTFGLSSNNAGLVLLLEKSSPRLRHKRLLTKAQGSGMSPKHRVLTT